MKMHRCLPLVLLILCAVHLSAADSEKFSEHPFFKHFVGTWKAAGELKAADGNIIKITEEWNCKISDEGELLIEGTRVIADNPPQKYRWTITHNPTTDLFEAVQVNPEDQQNAIRFEGNLSGDPPQLELKGQFGNGGGSVAVTDTFTGEGHDAFETKIVLLKDNGDTNLEGTLKNERVK
jgi:hypothetical protein